MIRTCIVDTRDHVVVNVVDYVAAVEGVPPGFDAHVLAVASDTAQVGWHYDGQAFSDPTPPLPAPIITTVDGAAFLTRVTDAEYTAITASANVQVRRWLDTFRLRGEIDVSGDTAQAAKAGLVKLGLLTNDRAEVIFAPA